MTLCTQLQERIATSLSTIVLPKPLNLCTEAVIDRAMRTWILVHYYYFCDDMVFLAPLQPDH